MGPTGGTHRWNPQVGPIGGTHRWDPQVGPRGGTHRWDPQVGSTSGTHRWDPQVGLANGAHKWAFQVRWQLKVITMETMVPYGSSLVRAPRTISLQTSLCDVGADFSRIDWPQQAGRVIHGCRWKPLCYLRSKITIFILFLIIC